MTVEISRPKKSRLTYNNKKKKTVTFIKDSKERKCTDSIHCGMAHLETSRSTTPTYWAEPCPVGARYLALAYCINVA